MRLLLLATLVCGGPALSDPAFVLLPARVFDGMDVHPGWQVRVEGERITAAGPEVPAAGATPVPLPGATLLPGLIDAHTHLLLHPYDETPWDEQVLKEPLGLRVARATVQARATLAAGFTTVRDLGTEGAGDADVGLKQAIARHVVPGPRMVVVTRALVALGSYAPRGFAPEVRVPQGAEEVGTAEEAVRAVRSQIRAGADWIKIYADYRYGPAGEARPAFSQPELAAMVSTAHDAGRPVAVHAVTAEAIRRAVLAGVDSVEHGDEASPEVWKLMAQRKVPLCPTLSAVLAVQQYGGWKPGRDPEPAVVSAKRASVRAAVAAGVPLCNGSDAGVFPHGDNVRELEALGSAGIPALHVLRAATSTDARMLRMEGRIGTIRPGALADLLAVDGDPLASLEALRHVRGVWFGGRPVSR